MRRERDASALARQERDGGANRDRTGDLLVANQTLSQLSYGPALFELHGSSWWVWLDLN
jgi:hypothetical protein